MQPFSRVSIFRRHYPTPPRTYANSQNKFLGEAVADMDIVVICQYTVPNLNFHALPLPCCRDSGIGTLYMANMPSPQLRVKLTFKSSIKAMQTHKREYLTIATASHIVHPEAETPIRRPPED